MSNLHAAGLHPDHIPPVDTFDDPELLPTVAEDTDPGEVDLERLIEGLRAL